MVSDSNDCNMVATFAQRSSTAVSVGERCACIECEKQIVQELGRPVRIRRLLVHLRKQERALDRADRTLTP
jgi:hypothetical protein